MELCNVCRRPIHVTGHIQCANCGSIVCETCLEDSENKCPICGFKG